MNITQAYHGMKTYDLLPKESYNFVSMLAIIRIPSGQDDTYFKINYFKQIFNLLLVKHKLEL